jgi:hypothetical protein
MKATLDALAPQGFTVRFEIEADSYTVLARKLTTLQADLAADGYTPTTAPPLTPDGLPICLKHRAVMDKRERQGDVWYSHKIVTDDGRELYCKGRPGDDSPGWAW